MPENKKFSMIVLAGGASSRMGRDKSKLMIGGKSFLEIQTEKGKLLGIRDILVSGYRGACDFPVIPDRHPGKGPLAGLEACLREAREAACLVLSVDVPFTPVEELEGLLAAYEASEKPAVILKAGDREQSLIGVYDRALAEEMEQEILLRKGSVFAFLRRVGYEVYESKADPEQFVNINDPELFERYCR